MGDPAWGRTNAMSLQVPERQGATEAQRAAGSARALRTPGILTGGVGRSALEQGIPTCTVAAPAAGEASSG